MPLTLVLGPANAAKAGEVLHAYALAAARDALLVVPTTADARHYERELASPGVTLGRTLTFPGLIDEIAARGGHRSNRLTALQRDRIVRRAVAAARLETLAGAAASPGFAIAAGRLIAELEQARVEPSRFAAALRGWAAGARERAAYARDLAAIYRRYRAELERIDRADDELFAWGALDSLRERPDVWGATPVYLYGFDDLTPVQLDAIETLATRAAAAVTVSLTYEPGRPALAARAGPVEELRAFAQSVRQLPALDEHYASGSSAALHHLERRLFEAEPPEVDPQGAVHLMEAAGERAEAELVAAGVLAALGAGVRPEELVVVCRSLERSGEGLEHALERVGVRAASGRRVPLGHTALGRSLLALVRQALLPVAQRRVEDLVAYLRHPGVAGSPEAVDSLERQLRLQGGGRSGEALRNAGAGLRPALRRLDELRLAPDRLAALAQCTRMLLAAPHRGLARVLEPPERQDAHAAAVVLAALVELAELERPGSVQQYPAAELIEVLDGLRVPVHGPGLEGAVLVAEPLSIRARRFRQVFVTGLCEGEFPSSQGWAVDPFLDDDRRREIALSSGVALPRAADPLDRERYLLYACASRATERVTFSYRSSDEEGNVVGASPFVEDVALLFGEGWRERRARRLLADVVWRLEQAPSERDRALARAFELGAGAGVGASAGSGAGWGSEAPPAWVLSETAMSVVRHREVVSAGALEKFAQCPVRWLVERQLQPGRLEPEAEVLSRGSFIHAVLERVFRRLGAALTAASLERAQRLLHEEMRGPDVAATRARVALAQGDEVRAAVLRGIEAELLRYLRHEASTGHGWTPLHTELRFGLDSGVGAMAPVELDDGTQRVLLSGVVDRIDADPADPGRVVLRDYKSGAHRDSWPAARWLDGAQLQVGLYMIAAERLLGVQVVAGFYQPLAGEDLRPRGVYEAGSGPPGGGFARDELSGADVSGLLDQIEEDAVELGARLRRGEIEPCPQTCRTDGSCAYPGICWSQR